ncbi:MAG: DUF1592 domain-containing protein [Planctomycetota bacterium]
MMKLAPFCVLLVAVSQIHVSGEQVGSIPKRHAKVLRDHCFDCHDQASVEGGIDLESLPLTMHSIEVAETWEKILDVLNTGAMPPEGSDPLPIEAKTELLADLSRQLVVARKGLADSGGVITMRRLNRREYRNTMESLLGVKLDVSDLPDDANSGGFDTNGASLFFSSDQFEQYLNIARKSLDQVIGRSGESRRRIKRMEPERDVLEFIFRDYLKRDESGELKQTSLSQLSREELSQYGPSNYRWFNHQAFLKNPLSEDGSPLYNLFSNFALPSITLPADGVGQRFVIRVRAAQIDHRTPEHRRYIEIGSVPSGVPRGELSFAGVRRVEAIIDAPEILEFDYVPLNQEQLKVIVRERHFNQLNAAKKFFRDAVDATGQGPPPSLWVDWVEWEGPITDNHSSPVRHRIFLPRIDGETTQHYHRRVLEAFAARAFRTKAPEATFIDRLMSMYEFDVAQGVPTEEALKEQLAIILASPGFLYLNEPTANRQERELSPQELAVRLSYFLWSSPPDDELSESADSGLICQPTELRRLTHKMLQDPRSDEFIAGFAHQWLHMERLDFFQFNYRKHPRFDDSVKESARQEVYESIADSIRNRRPIRELLRSDYVMVNDLLAGYYGIDGVDGAHFRRVAVPDGLPRGGLLGMAAVMAMGSDGDRSSPVERGAWILRCLLNDPPPPAPPNVPQLSRLDGEVLTARQLQKAHQEEPQCAQCHRKIDPLGFGLENFDAAGRWRDDEVLWPSMVELTDREKKDDPNWRDKIPQPQRRPIQSAGTMPDGEAFRDYFELCDQIAEREDQFVRGLTEQLIAYGLGRPYSFTDEDLALEMIARAKRYDYAISELIVALIESPRFRKK